VIGTDGRVAAVIKSETRMAAHADRALAILREMAAT
jgi:peroxiredoxin